MKYRADIDGLRALAIIPVVLFHAGSGLFSGGFVGVDVFFVISGYLITSILVRDLGEGRFSLSCFYEKRARRILPAYIFMMLIVSMCGYHLFLASELKNLAESMLSSLGFISNIFFWRNSGYFSIQAESSPFLHTWSLSVEEQFYIFFPLGLMFLYKYFNKKTIYIVLIFTLFISLMISIVGMERSVQAMFYLLPSRAWELLVGAVLALGVVPVVRSKALNELLSIAGFLMIIIAIFLYSKNTLFPGAAALLPVIGAALIIHAGALGNLTYIGKMLSLKYFVFIGGISYSLYLWHWPIFVFIKNLHGDVIRWDMMILGIVLSLIIAWLSTIMIEKPFIKKRILSQKKPLLLASFTSIIVSMTICLFLIVNDGFPGRFEEHVLEAESSLSDFSQRRNNCHAGRGNPIPYADKCIFGSDVKPSYAFWGDSHAVELSDSVGQYASMIGISGLHISYSSCPPSQGYSSAVRPMCEKHNTEVLEGLISDVGIKTVFMIARYSSYTRTNKSKEAMFKGFEETIRKLKKSGKDVVIIYPIPKAEGIAPLAIARKLSRNDDISNYSISLHEYSLQNVDVLSKLDDIVSAFSVDTIKPTDVLCSDQVSCKFYIHGDVTHFDDDHLSLSGAKLFLPKIIEHIVKTNN